MTRSDCQRCVVPEREEREGGRAGGGGGGRERGRGGRRQTDKVIEREDS